MCAKCGHYRGRKIIDMTAIVAKQTARDKRKAEAVK